MLRAAISLLAIASAAPIVKTCSVGTLDCSTVGADFDGTCANYNQLYPEPQTQDGIMALAAIFGMFMAFGIGANDAANSWGTSVGSKAITVGYAVILCGFFEWAGATSLGYGVSKTIQKGVAKIDDPNCWACGSCDSKMTLAMGGSLGALFGASMFLAFASRLAVPVSTTHSIVGGVVGMTMAGAGPSCLNWAIKKGLTGIVLSWIISPVLSGIMGGGGYYLSKKFVIKTNNAKRRAMILLPLLYGVSMFGLLMLVFLKSKAVKKRLELPTKLIISGSVGLGVIFLVYFFLLDIVRKSLPSNTGETQMYLERKNRTVEMTKKIKSSSSAPATNDSQYDTEKPAVKAQLSTSVVVIESTEDSPSNWTVDRVASWVSELEESRFEYMAANLRNANIDGTALLRLGEADLRELSVKNIGDRKTLMKAIEKLAEAAEAPQSPREAKFEALTQAAIEGADEDGLMTPSLFLDADNGDQLDAIFVFRYILVFNACLESFAHGSNDTANATGPFAMVYQTYKGGLDACDSDEGTIWIMCIAGLFVALGVGTFGYRVIRTIGENITVIDYHKGFWIEFGSTFATIMATILEFPVSTTHCQVGGVIGVGIISSMQGTGRVSWGLFGKIFATWVLTLPIAGGCAAIVVMVVKGAVIQPDQMICS